MSELTRQHFKEIAETIKRVVREIDKKIKQDGKIKKEELNRTICNMFADYLATTNPRFDRSRFMEACLIKEESK